MSLTDVLENNFKTILVVVATGFVALQRGWIEAPAGLETSPQYVGLAAIAAGAVGVGGWIVGAKVDDLLPDPEGIFLVCLESNDETGGEIWELTEDQFADMEVKEGTLFEWPVSSQVYECYHYNYETNTAVAGWRESPTGSQLAGGIEIEEAFAAIDEIRSEYEPAERKLKRIRRRLGAVARRMDRRRARDQNAILEPELTPEFGDSSATITDIIEDEFPEHLQPESMNREDETEPEAPEPGGIDEFAGFEVLDESEPLQND
jgi:hypothetical protein